MKTLLERVRDRSAKVVVVGQGYVGLPVAMRASAVGFPVIGLDASAHRVAEHSALVFETKNVMRGRAFSGEIL